jgi:hypothetical protein
MLKTATRHQRPATSARASSSAAIGPISRVATRGSAGRSITPSARFPAATQNTMPSITIRT